MAETNETIGAIIAEMCGGPIPHHRRDQELLRHYADRLEAAWKREKAAIEADALAVGGLVEASHKRELSKIASKNGTDFGQLGNAAKMREALASISAYAQSAQCHTEDSHVLGYLRQIDNWVRAAIAKPPRNCDVGTAEEQEKRFMRYCDSKVCNRRYCACGYEELFRHKCAIRWSQMPYEEGENK